MNHPISIIQLLVVQQLSSNPQQVAVAITARSAWAEPWPFACHVVYVEDIGEHSCHGGRFLEREGTAVPVGNGWKIWIDQNVNSVKHGCGDVFCTLL